MSPKKKYLAIIGIGAATCLLEGTGVHTTGSNSLLADLLHWLGDTISPALGLVALMVYLTTRAKNIERSIVYFNLFVLVVTVLFVGGRGFWNIFHPIDNPGWHMLPFAVVSLVGNRAVVYFSKGLEHAHHHKHTGESQQAHAKADYYTSLAIVAGSVLVGLTGLTIFDALTSLYAAWRVSLLLRELWRTGGHHHH